MTSAAQRGVAARERGGRRRASTARTGPGSPAAATTNTAPGTCNLQARRGGGVGPSPGRPRPGAAGGGRRQQHVDGAARRAKGSAVNDSRSTDGRDATGIVPAVEGPTAWTPHRQAQAVAEPIAQRRAAGGDDPSTPTTTGRRTGGRRPIAVHMASVIAPRLLDKGRKPPPHPAGLPYLRGRARRTLKVSRTADLDATHQGRRSHEPDHIPDLLRAFGRASGWTRRAVRPYLDVRSC